MKDLQGPKILVGFFIDGGLVTLAEDAILTNFIVGMAQRVGYTHAELAKDVRAGDQLLLGNGQIPARVIAT